MENLSFKVPPEVAMELTRKMYENNFFTVWTREVVQNSVDAFASFVKIYNEYVEGVTQLKVIDNGSGMTRDVIYHNFLALGGSFKESKYAIGGFGIAKSVVLAGNIKSKSPHRDYDVYWYVVTTSKEKDGEYKTYYFDSEMMGKEPLAELSTREQTGTEIVVFRDEYCSSYRVIETLENCNVGVSLFYNDDEMFQLTRARKKATLDWATVYYRKKAFDHQKGYCIVRIGGVYQFKQRVSNRMDGVAIVEIESSFTPTDDKYPLTPNREQLKSDYGYREELDSVLEEFKGPEMIREDDQPFVFETFVNPNYTPESDIDTNFEWKQKREEEIHYIDLSEEEKEEQNRWENENKDALQKNNVTEDFVSNEYKEKQRREEEKRQQMLKLQETWEKIENEIRGFHPALITAYEREKDLSFNIQDITIKRDRSMKNKIDYFNETNLKKLYCFKKFIDLIFIFSKHYIPKFDYHVGWTITDKARAEFVYRNGEKYILLNPVKLSVTDIRLFTSNVVQRLVHEMLHNQHSWHDEYFIASFHGVMEECINPNIREFEKIARQILKG